MDLKRIPAATIHALNGKMVQEGSRQRFDLNTSERHDEIMYTAPGFRIGPGGNNTEGFASESAISSTRLFKLSEKKVRFCECRVVPMSTLN
jgi:hypothetical protein